MAVNQYGVREQENIRDFCSEQEQQEFISAEITVEWTDPDLAKVVRLRLMGPEFGCPFYDVSYCWGVLKSGAKCHVILPFYQLWKRDGGIKAQIIAHAKRDGVFAKGLGILDAISILW